jgi:hypothetical protein
MISKMFFLSDFRPVKYTKMSVAEQFLSPIKGPFKGENRKLLVETHSRITVRTEKFSLNLCRHFTLSTSVAAEGSSKRGGGRAQGHRGTFNRLSISASVLFSILSNSGGTWILTPRSGCSCRFYIVHSEHTDS